MKKAKKTEESLLLMLLLLNDLSDIQTDKLTIDQWSLVMYEASVDACLVVDACCITTKGRSTRGTQFINFTKHSGTWKWPLALLLKLQSPPGDT